MQRSEQGQTIQEFKRSINNAISFAPSLNPDLYPPTPQYSISANNQNNPCPGVPIHLQNVCLVYQLKLYKCHVYVYISVNISGSLS